MDDPKLSQLDSTRLWFGFRLETIFVTAPAATKNDNAVQK